MLKNRLKFFRKNERGGNWHPMWSLKSSLKRRVFGGEEEKSICGRELGSSLGRGIIIKKLSSELPKITVTLLPSGINRYLFLGSSRFLLEATVLMYKSERFASKRNDLFLGLPLRNCLLVGLLCLLLCCSDSLQGTIMLSRGFGLPLSLARRRLDPKQSSNTRVHTRVHTREQTVILLFTGGSS